MSANAFASLRAALSLPWNDLPPREALKRAEGEASATMDAACTWLAACVHHDGALATSELLFWVGQAKAARERLAYTREQVAKHPFGKSK